jgi:hypothetical protein
MKGKVLKRNVISARMAGQAEGSTQKIETNEERTSW